MKRIIEQWRYNCIQTLCTEYQHSKETEGLRDVPGGPQSLMELPPPSCAFSVDLFVGAWVNMTECVCQSVVGVFNLAGNVSTCAFREKACLPVAGCTASAGQCCRALLGSAAFGGSTGASLMMCAHPVFCLCIIFSDLVRCLIRSVACFYSSCLFFYYSVLIDFLHVTCTHKIYAGFTEACSHLYIYIYLLL